MNPYYNLPPQQRMLQRSVDQWNADEALWRRLASRRRLRRKLLCGLSKNQLHELDLREHAANRPPDDCVGVVHPAHP